MYQAITTKYLPPSNVRGSRIKAECQRGSRIFEWDHRKNQDENHIEAARLLCQSFIEEDRAEYGEGGSGAWNPDKLHSGYDKRGNGVHVFTYSK